MYNHLFLCRKLVIAAVQFSTEFRKQHWYHDDESFCIYDVKGDNVLGRLMRFFLEPADLDLAGWLQSDDAVPEPPYSLLRIQWPPELEDVYAALVGLWHDMSHILNCAKDLIIVGKAEQYRWPSGDAAAREALNDFDAGLVKLRDVLRFADKRKTSRTKKQPSGKRILVNNQMATILTMQIESVDWTAQQWADRLKCSKSTVAATQMWKALLARRNGVRLERVTRSLEAEGRRQKSSKPND
jgi:hypothetical protein